MVTATDPVRLDVWVVLPVPLNDDPPEALSALGLMKLSGPELGGVTLKLPAYCVLVPADFEVEVDSISSTVIGSPTCRARLPSTNAA